MEKITPLMKSAVYQLAAKLCDDYANSTNSITAGTPYGCHAIGLAIVSLMPHLRSNTDLHDYVTDQLCDVFTSLFSNGVSDEDCQRDKYGEFGSCALPESQNHRITALCLMSDIAKDYA
jgi:hypothetical protein